MNCKEVREHLLDLVVAEPGPGKLRDHMKACAACTDELNSMRQTMALLDEWQAPADTSPYFTTRLRARLREEQAQPAGWLQWFRKPALAVSLMVLMIASISLFQGGGNVKDNVAGHPVVAGTPGTAVGDLQYLDRNHDMLTDFELLDDLDGSPSTAQN
jgi:predicted anti-sigma-YlaC factor YlaD